MTEITDRETAILGLLAEKSRHGYEIEKVIEERGYRDWTDIGFSSIYYILNRLEDKGLIESKIIDVEGKPSRRVYNITEVGVSVLQEKVKALLSNPAKLISPLDLGIAHIPMLKPEVVVECLKNYIKSLGKSIDFLENAYYQHEENSPYFVTALFSRPLAHLKTEKLWLELFVKFIEDDIIK
ncbi:MAG: PadR family transcriptional regulator [Promethearchaeota archaeon]